MSSLPIEPSRTYSAPLSGLGACAHPGAVLSDSQREAYLAWIKLYIRFFDKRHPRELAAAQVEQFLSHLAVERNVAASTQKQSKPALLFLYKDMLKLELSWLEGVAQARVPKRLPLLLTRAEVEQVLIRLRGPGCTSWRAVRHGRTR